MRAIDVKIGGVYTAKVSGRRVPVRVIRPLLSERGWLVMNLRTKREVAVHSAGRFREEIDADQVVTYKGIQFVAQFEDLKIPTGPGRADVPDVNWHWHEVVLEEFRASVAGVAV